MGEENEVIKEETKALIKQIESEQGNLSQYTDQQERASKQKVEGQGKAFLKDIGIRYQANFHW